jgi:flagellar hook-basal body complex protein FliE
MIEKIYSSPIRRLYDIEVGNVLPKDNSPTVSFGNYLKDAISSLNDTQLQADSAINSFVKGDDIYVHQVMLSMQKAELTLNLAMQLRNKVVAAYEEIMRMQV